MLSSTLMDFYFLKCFWPLFKKLHNAVLTLNVPAYWTFKFRYVKQFRISFQIKRLLLEGSLKDILRVKVNRAWMFPMWIPRRDESMWWLETEAKWLITCIFNAQFQCEEPFGFKWTNQMLFEKALGELRYPETEKQAKWLLALFVNASRRKSRSQSHMLVC